MHCITFTFSQCFMHYRCVISLLEPCVLVGLDQAEPMMFLLLHVTCSCIFHAYIPFFSILLILTLFGTLLLLSLFVSLLVSLCMAPKHKSALSRNPLSSEASSSSNPTPSYVRFHDDKAHQDFSENFSRRSIHSEHQVILSDFSDTNLPTIIHSRDQESLCDILVSYPSMIIQEFYSNMHGFDYSIPHFVTHIQGTRIVVTPDLISEVLHVLRVEFANYLDCPHLRTMSKD